MIWSLIPTRRTPRPQPAPRPREQPPVNAAVTTAQVPEAARSQATQDVDVDAWEGWFIEEAADPTPSKARLRIAYMDRNGARTERDIQVVEFDNAPSNAVNGMLIAHCALRGATRTFRFGRIEKAVDRDTGEVVADVQTHLRDLWMASPEFALEEFQAEFSRPLEVLLFIAKADGRVVAKERSVILDFCRAHLRDSRITEDAVLRALRDVRKVSMGSFKLSVGKLVAEHRDLLPALVQAAQQIVGAEKTVHPAEREALEYLARRAGGSGTQFK